MSASQTRRSAGVLARLAARLFEKNRVPAAAGRPFVPVHVSAAGLQPGQPRTSALTLRHPFYEADVQGEAPQLHTDDNWPTTSKDDSDQFGAPGRSSGRSRLPSTALPPRASPPGGKPAVFVWTSCLPRDCFPCFCVSPLGCTPACVRGFSLAIPRIPPNAPSQTSGHVAPGSG